MTCRVPLPHVSPFCINLTEKELKEIKMIVWTPYFPGALMIVTGQNQPRKRSDTWQSALIKYIL